MADRVSNQEAWKRRELMLMVTRRPFFCCCCVCLASEDRRRARRVYRLTRHVMRDWRRAEKARIDANEPR